MLSYEIDIVGLKRELPICRVSDDLYIGAFVIFGDVELTVHCASELLKIAPEYDYIIAPEAKSIPLLYEMARQSGEIRRWWPRMCGWGAIRRRRQTGFGRGCARGAST